MTLSREVPFQAWLAAMLSAVLIARVGAQESKPAQPSKPQPAETPSVREVGGRLVVTGETVVVTGNPDEPPRESSIGTKIDTPLSLRGHGLFSASWRRISRIAATQLRAWGRFSSPVRLDAWPSS